MRGCNEARPSRDLGEQGLQLQRASAESAKTRGASFSEPAALKVQLVEVAVKADSYRSYDSEWKNRSSLMESQFPFRTKLLPD